MPLRDTLKTMVASSGEDLLALSMKQPVLLVFLRHFGCVFCREALHDLSELKETIIQKDYQLVFVHMSDFDIAHKFFVEYHLEGHLQIADKECNFYKAFGLAKGSFSQLLGLRNMSRGFDATFNKGIFPNHKWIGDGFQMPGIFMINEGEVKKSFIHQFAGQKPDYLAMME